MFIYLSHFGYRSWVWPSCGRYQVRTNGIRVVRPLTVPFFEIVFFLNLPQEKAHRVSDRAEDREEQHPHRSASLTVENDE